MRSPDFAKGTTFSGRLQPGGTRFTTEEGDSVAVNRETAERCTILRSPVAMALGSIRAVQGLTQKLDYTDRRAAARRRSRPSSRRSSPGSSSDPLAPYGHDRGSPGNRDRASERGRRHFAPGAAGTASSDSGSTRAPWRRTAQCRCGPVARPVAPTSPRIAPCSTRSFRSTDSVDR